MSALPDDDEDSLDGLDEDLFASTDVISSVRCMHTHAAHQLTAPHRPTPRCRCRRAPRLRPPPRARLSGRRTRTRRSGSTSTTLALAATMSLALATSSSCLDPLCVLALIWSRRPPQCLGDAAKQPAHVPTGQFAAMLCAHVLLAALAALACADDAAPASSETAFKACSCLLAGPSGIPVSHVYTSELPMASEHRSHSSPLTLRRTLLPLDLPSSSSTPRTSLLAM